MSCWNSSMMTATGPLASAAIASMPSSPLLSVGSSATRSVAPMVTDSFCSATSYCTSGRYVPNTRRRVSPTRSIGPASLRAAPVSSACASSAVVSGLIRFGVVAQHDRPSRRHAVLDGAENGRLPEAPGAHEEELPPVDDGALHQVELLFAIDELTLAQLSPELERIADVAKVGQAAS